MSLTVNFLAPLEANSELRTLFRQLALLWKFELCELMPGEPTEDFDPDRLLIVDAGSDDRNYQKMVAQHVGATRSRCLLFSTQVDFNHSGLKALSGVNAIVRHAYHCDLDVDVLADDALLKGLAGPLRLLKFNQCSCGAISLLDAHALLLADDGATLMACRGNCYTIALPIWQFGIVSFPVWFSLMENALFFNDGLPHIAPGPYAAVRIDDVPVTGESYIKQGYTEFRGCAEIRAIQRASSRYGARIEYMLTENVLKDGRLMPAQEVAPKAFGLLTDLYRKGEINVGGHGYVHLDVTAYRQYGKIEAREFLTLGEAETRTAMQSIKQWAGRTFSKDNMGFVAPAWGYREGITRPVARGLFSYIADSNQRLQRSAAGDLFGSVRSGCVSMFETWRSGMSGIRMADRKVFGAYLGAGLPVHLMLHSVWTSDPLTRGSKFALLALAIVAALTVNLALLFSLGGGVLLALMLLQGGLAWGVYRQRLNLGWWLRWVISCRTGIGERLEHLARSASQSGAQWLFVEELAEHMASYEGLSVRFEILTPGSVSAVLDCSRKFSRPVSVHFPFPVEKAVLQPTGWTEIKGNVLFLGPLDQGTHRLKVSGKQQAMTL